MQARDVNAAIISCGVLADLLNPAGISEVERARAALRALQSDNGTDWHTAKVELMAVLDPRLATLTVEAFQQPIERVD